MNIRFFENPLSRSLSIHGLLLLIAFVYITQFAKPMLPMVAPIEVSFTDRPQEIESKKEELKKKLDEDKNTRMVRRSEGELALQAKKDAYLSEKTRVVEEEKTAVTAGELEAKAKSIPEKSATVNPPPKSVTLSDLGVKLAPDVAPKAYEKTRNWAAPQIGETLRGGEYIKGLKEGEVSALNTKESIFFSYYNRVRIQLDQAWPPILKANIEHIFKSGRRLASKAEYVTRVYIVLDEKGDVKKVQVLEESGTHDLDQAAIDALNKAGPYPHPPKGLIDSSGLVQIKWDFILKT